MIIIPPKALKMEEVLGKIKCSGKAVLEGVFSLKFQGL
jgi:hypothetical protein